MHIKTKNLMNKIMERETKMPHDYIKRDAWLKKFKNNKETNRKVPDAISKRKIKGRAITRYAYTSY